MFVITVREDAILNTSMDESNTVVSAYTMYRHLQQYCSHPSIYREKIVLFYSAFGLWLHKVVIYKWLNFH